MGLLLQYTAMKKYKCIQESLYALYDSDADKRFDEEEESKLTLEWKTRCETRLNKKSVVDEL